MHLAFNILRGSCLHTKILSNYSAHYSFTCSTVIPKVKDHNSIFKSEEPRHRTESQRFSSRGQLHNYVVATSVTHYPGKIED